MVFKKDERHKAGSAGPASQANGTNSDEAAWEAEDVFSRDDVSPEAPAVESLEAQIELERQRNLRMAADFENHKRRIAKERSKLLLYANEKLLKQFLPLVDDIERAMTLARETPEEVAQSFVEGVGLIADRFKSVLDKAGVKSFESEGLPFDPTRHEAVMQRLDPNAAPGIILQDFEKGYLLYNRLLRPARVVVNSRKPLFKGVVAGVEKTAAVPVEQSVGLVEKSAAAAVPEDVLEPNLELSDLGMPSSPEQGVVELDESELGSFEDWEREFDSSD